jgi:hypothetical protein
MEAFEEARAVAAAPVIGRGGGAEEADAQVAVAEALESVFAARTAAKRVKSVGAAELNARDARPWPSRTGWTRRSRARWTGAGSSTTARASR